MPLNALIKRIELMDTMKSTQEELKIIKINEFRMVSNAIWLAN